MMLDVMNKYSNTYQKYVDENPGISENKKTIKYGEWNCYFIQDQNGAIY